MPLLSVSISNPIVRRSDEPKPTYLHDTTKVSTMRLMTPLPLFPVGEKNPGGCWEISSIQERYLSSEGETSESPDESGNESLAEACSKQRDYSTSASVNVAVVIRYVFAGRPSVIEI